MCFNVVFLFYSNQLGTRGCVLFVGVQAAAAGLGAVGAAAAAVAGARPNGLAALCLGAWGAAEAAAVLWERLRQDAAPGATLWGGSTLHARFRSCLTACRPRGADAPCDNVEQRASTSSSSSGAVGAGCGRRLCWA